MKHSFIPMALACASAAVLAQGWQTPQNDGQILLIGILPGHVQSFFTAKPHKSKKAVRTRVPLRQHKAAPKPQSVQRPLIAAVKPHIDTSNGAANTKPWALPAVATLFMVPRGSELTTPPVPASFQPLVIKAREKVKRKPAVQAKQNREKVAKADVAPTKVAERKPKVSERPAKVTDKHVASDVVISKTVKADKITKPIEIIDPNTRKAPVAPMADKFAFIVGNTDSRIEDAKLPYAGDDADLIRQTLITHAGYPEGNIQTVINGTASQILAAAAALSLRVPDKGTVFIYFTGLGENIDGKDYLAGVDTPAEDAVGTMLAKDALFNAFLSRGARVFAFFQSNRPIRDGIFFGSEINSDGAVAQMQATVPGGRIYSTTSNGKQIGLFTNGVVATLAEAHSNQVAVVPFGWEVYYSLRRNGTGTELGSTAQSPSLPVLTNMSADARF